ncbi:MAG: hypothetical protein RL177_252 [Bacteroidota bacterium]|jgi:hypothetical protein
MKYSIFLLLTALFSWVPPSLIAQSPHDVYDLRLGVERLFATCLNIPPYPLCPIDSPQYMLERVTGVQSIGDYSYAKVDVFNVLDGFTPVLVPFETRYYRVDGQALIQRIDHMDVVLAEFSATVGDSIKDIFHPIPALVGNFEIKADIQVNFDDEQSYRMLYGDDTPGEIDSVSFVLNYLSDTVRQFPLRKWRLPFKPFQPSQNPTPTYRTFLYVSRFGVLFTPLRDKDIKLIAFKGHDGTTYGMYTYFLTSIEDDLTERPSWIQLLDNYPNPFNPSTVIRFQLKAHDLASSYARLAVFDVLGREVAVISDAFMPNGEHHVTFDASGLPSGMYLYRLDSGGESVVGKMMLMK